MEGPEYDGRLVLDLDPTAEPAAAIAAEEDLVALVAGEEVTALRIWECAEAIVLPRHRLRSSPPTRRPLLARRSGGGAVRLGPGVLCVSLAVPIVAGAPSIDAGYRLWLAGLRAALAAYRIEVESGAVPGSFCDGAHNAVVSGRKLAGTAQARRGRVALVHGCLLVDVDREEYCAALAEVGVAARPDLITTVREEAGREIDSGELASRIAVGFAKATSRSFAALSESRTRGRCRPGSGSSPPPR